MNIVIKKIIITMVFMIISVFPDQLVLASSSDYLVTPVLPNNQNPDVPGYFDLTVIPGQKQILQLKVKNQTNENQKYKIYVNTATTNQNGIIDYSISEFDKDESMEISLKDYINISGNQVEVPANSEKKISLELNVPGKPFDGIVLGGVTVEPIVEKGKSGVNNLVTRTLAIQISEFNKKVIPKLKGGKILISQENLRNNVKFELRNCTPTIITKLKSKISITKKGNTTPIIEQTKEQLSFAPNSKFKLMTEWNQQFEPGKYIYNINLNDEEGNKWQFIKEFEIEGKISEKLNKISVDEKKNQNKYFSNYIIILLIIIIALTGWVILKIFF